MARNALAKAGQSLVRWLHYSARPSPTKVIDLEGLGRRRTGIMQVTHGVWKSVSELVSKSNSSKTL